MQELQEEVWIQNKGLSTHKRKSGGGVGGGGNSNKTCNNCGDKGHVGNNCWKKHPKKAPQWYKDLKANQAIGASVEIMLSLIDMSGTEEVSFGCLKVDRERARVVASQYLSGSQNENKTKTDGLKITELVKATVDLKICDAKNAFVAQSFV